MDRITSYGQLLSAAPGQLEWGVNPSSYTKAEWIHVSAWLQQARLERMDPSRLLGMNPLDMALYGLDGDLTGEPVGEWDAGGATVRGRVAARFERFSVVRAEGTDDFYIVKNR